MLIKATTLDTRYKGTIGRMELHNNPVTSGVAMGAWGQLPPTFAKMVLEIFLKSMRKQVWGGGSSRSSEK